MFYNKQTVGKNSGKGFSLKEGFKVASIKGGTIAKQARKKLEDQTGKSVITGQNFLPPKKKNQ